MKLPILSHINFYFITKKVINLEKKYIHDVKRKKPKGYKLFMPRKFNIYKKYPDGTKVKIGEFDERDL